MRGTLYVADDSRPAATWDGVVARLAQSKTFWLATNGEGGPHVMPLLAVTLDGRIFFCAGPQTRKARNLARDSRCVLTTAAEGMDIVVEGEAVIITDDPTLRRVAGAYLSKYGWDAEPRDGALWAEGAPTAGPPPLDLYELRPRKVFSFGTDESVNAMRWTMSA